MKQEAIEASGQTLSLCDVSFSGLGLDLRNAMDLYKSDACPGLKMASRSRGALKKLDAGVLQPPAVLNVSCPRFKSEKMDADAKRCSYGESPFLSRKASSNRMRDSCSLRVLSPHPLDYTQIDRRENQSSLDFVGLLKAGWNPPPQLAEYESTLDFAVQQSESGKDQSSIKHLSIMPSEIVLEKPSLKDQFNRAARLVVQG